MKSFDNHDYEKYLKYKLKYNKLKNQNGGMIKENDVLLKIESIGFEFETKFMSPLEKTIDYKTMSYEESDKKKI